MAFGRMGGSGSEGGTMKLNLRFAPIAAKARSLLNGLSQKEDQDEEPFLIGTRSQHEEKEA